MASINDQRQALFTERLLFRGTGSISADAALRAQIDQAYWQSNGLIPPFDLSPVGKIGETGFFTSAHDYRLA